MRGSLRAQRETRNQKKRTKDPQAPRRRVFDVIPNPVALFANGGEGPASLLNLMATKTIDQLIINSPYGTTGDGQPGTDGTFPNSGGWPPLNSENALALVTVFDKERPIRSTSDMQPWYTRGPCEPTARSLISLCVFDSRWAASEAFELDRNSHVVAWVKNDHLGFEVLYVYRGIVQKFRPDYLIRLTKGKMLVLEVKGQDTQQDRTKRQFLAEWV